MKLFLDTEFTGLHKNTTLISIALVTEYGNCFYAELTDYDKDQCDDWIKENVIKNLSFALKDQFYLDEPATLLIGGKRVEAMGFHNTWCKGGKDYVKNRLQEWLDIMYLELELSLKNFVAEYAKHEVWVDVGSYDWVLFQDLFGGAFKMPECVYYIPFDISGKFKELNLDPDIDRHNFAVMYTPKGMTVEIHKTHNALFDAKISRLCHEILEQKYRDMIAGVQAQAYQAGFEAGQDGQSISG